MKKSKAITAGAIALTLTLGGAGLLAGQYVSAAAAADSQSSASTQSTAAEAGTIKGDRAGKRGGFGHGFGQIGDQLKEYLGIDEETLRTKLETMTLAELAAEQGKTREELKAKLVEWLEAAEAEAPAGAQDDANADKPDAATIAEKLLDSQGFGKLGGGKGGFGGGFIGKNLDAAAEALGITSDELKTELAAGKTIAAVAASKGVAVQTAIDAIVSETKEKLSEELSAGTITQEQYDAKLEKAVERATDQVNGELPARGEGGKRGFGGGFIGGSLDAAAEALGMTEDELKAELAAGKTIADTASAKGMAVQTVIDAIVSETKEKLSEELTAGTITQEQYDTKLEKAAERATDLVNGELTARGGGGKGMRGERPAADQDETATDTADSTATVEG